MKLILIKQPWWLGHVGCYPRQKTSDGNMTMPTSVDRNVAAQIPVLHGLKPEAMAILLTGASVANIRPGHILFRQSEPAVVFSIILDGWIKLYRVTPAGDEAVLDVLTTGQSFVNAVTLTTGFHPATACAVTRARVLMIPAEHVVNCIREIPDIGIALISSTSHRLHELAERVEQLTAQSAIQRVADFLMSLAPCAKGPCTIALPYDKSVIAGRLGLKPESLSRVFAKMRAIGIDVRASEVFVSDVAGLRCLIAGDRVRSGSCWPGKPEGLRGIRENRGGGVRPIWRSAASKADMT